MDARLLEGVSGCCAMGPGGPELAVLCERYYEEYCRNGKYTL